MKLKFAAILAALPLYACGVGLDEPYPEHYEDLGLITAEQGLSSGYEGETEVTYGRAAVDAGVEQENSAFTVPSRDPLVIPQDPIPAKDKRPLGPRPPCNDREWMLRGG